MAWSFYEALNYKSAVFYNMDEIAELEGIAYQNDDSLLVSITTDSHEVDVESILNAILENVHYWTAMK